MSVRCYYSKKERTPEFITQAEPIHDCRREDQLLVRELYIRFVVLDLVLHQVVREWVDVDGEVWEGWDGRVGWGVLEWGLAVWGLAVWIEWGLEAGIGLVCFGLGWDGDWELVVCVQATEGGYEDG